MIVSNNARYCAILINVLFQLNLVQLKKGNTFLEEYEKEIYPLFVSCMKFPSDLETVTDSNLLFLNGFISRYMTTLSDFMLQ